MKSEMSKSADIEEVRGWVEEARRMVVLTDAGISTESGIPDFRGPQGVWIKDPRADAPPTKLRAPVIERGTPSMGKIEFPLNSRPGVLEQRGAAGSRSIASA